MDLHIYILLIPNRLLNLPVFTFVYHIIYINILFTFVYSLFKMLIFVNHKFFASPTCEFSEY